MDRKKILLIVLLAFSVFIVGILTDLKFSDEIFHFWFAKDWFESGHRPVYNKLVDTLEEYGHLRYYVNAPLWHFGLRSLWKIWGNASKNVAQLYQALIYLLLIVNTYLLGKELYGKTVGWYAAIIVATIPMFVSFSILFFIDMPLAMLTPLCLLFIIRRKFVWAGLILSLMFYTKRNAYLLFPAFSFLALCNIGSDPLSLSKRIKNLLLFSLVIFIITIPDFAFRYKNFNGLIVPGDKGQTVETVRRTIITPGLSAPIFGEGTEPTKEKGPRYVNYLPSSIAKPVNVPKYLGLVFPLLVIPGLINFRKLIASKDLILLAPIFIYLPLYAIVFGGWLGIGMRWLSPIIPLMVILTAKVFTFVRNKRLKCVVFVLCAVQFLSVLLFVYDQRQLNLSEREALSYIRDKIPTDSRILTPEELFISYYTDRPTVWLNSFVNDDISFLNLLWGTEGAVKREILHRYKIAYVAVQKLRIYDDSTVRHTGGYPKSLVKKFPTLPFLKKVYENDFLSMWSVE